MISDFEKMKTTLESHECETISVFKDDILDTIVIEQPDYDGNKVDTIVLTFDQAKGLCNAIYFLLKENKIVVSFSGD